jgi:S-adenosylmethionine-dependent methyltransferase
MKTPDDENDRFRSGARDYAAYLETPEGRLRIDLSIANLQEFLPEAKRPLRALDLGCGTGAIAVRLARLGHGVTGLDSSLPMLEFAERAAREAGVTGKVELKHADAAQFESLLQASSFDVILCHNILEFVDDPVAVLCSAGRMLKDSSAILSVLVRNHAGEVLKAALTSGDLDAAEHQIAAQWGRESLYGGRVQLFTPDDLLAISKQARLEVIAMRGVRVIADYLPPQISRDTEYNRIFELERKLGQRAEFAPIARYTQVLAHRANAATEGRA